MNKYLVEDEYSFYEIDPECKIGPLREEKPGKKFGCTEECEKENTDTGEWKNGSLEIGEWKNGSLGTGEWKNGSLETGEWKRECLKNKEWKKEKKEYQNLREIQEEKLCGQKKDRNGRQICQDGSCRLFVLFILWKAYCDNRSRSSKKDG